MPFADVRGKSLHYTDTNPKATKAIVFVHGLGSTQNFYAPSIPHLTSADYRCVAFDNYGAGRSKYLPDSCPETSVEEIGRDALGLMDFLDVQKAVVVGFSMGGMVPTWLAGNNMDEGARERIVAGICIGPVNPGSGVADVFKKRIETVREGGMETMANSIPEAATGPRTTALQKAFIREMLLAQDPEGYIANCRAIQTATPPAYDQVRCPMLIIAGEVDKSAPVDGCRYIFEHLGTDANQKRLETLEGIGHWYCVEDGDSVGRLMKEFVDGLQF